MKLNIRRLEESDQVEGFDCGDAPLNSYLKLHAWTNQSKISIGVTHVAVEATAPTIVLGYFTLAAASAPRDRFPKKCVRGLPPYDLPIILLARLAVDLRFGVMGLGSALISEAFEITVRVASETGRRCIVTDAYREKADFYSRFGFIALEDGSSDGPRRMFLDVRTIRAALKGIPPG